MFDYVLCGGGLANGLAALALRARRPGVRLALVEAEAAIGGNHTWSFHGGDLDDAGQALLAPLVVHRSDEVEVRFPERTRVLETSYASVSSARLDAAVRAAVEVPGSRLFLGARATAVGPREVALADGTCVRGELVLDARGPARPQHFEATGFQKFLGLEVELPADAASALPARPIVMDATVDQIDGYRFVYVLPLGGRRVLVEDTYYSDSPALDEASLEARLRAYMDGRGWTRGRIVRRERGVLPIPWGGEPAPPLGAPLRLGYAGGWFHPTTGYSLPIAARVALTIAESRPETAAAALRALWRELAPQRRFTQRLNRWLFRAVAPANRLSIFSRFYSLPLGSIERFYAFRTTPADRARIVCGRPPRGVSLRSVLFPTEAV